MCDQCPCSYHLECIGLDAVPGGMITWACPQHACLECDRKAGAVGHAILVIVLCTLIFSLGWVGASIVNHNGALPPVDLEGWVGRVVHKEAVAAVASVLTLKLLATHKLYVQVDTHPIE